MRPTLTYNPNEPDFFAPIEEWEEFFKTLSLSERIEFHNVLEMVIETIRGIRFEKKLEFDRQDEKLLPGYCLGNLSYWN